MLDALGFLADGGGCEMQRLGELRYDECWEMRLQGER
jgi:hypothetical protein